MMFLTADLMFGSDIWIDDNSRKEDLSDTILEYGFGFTFQIMLNFCMITNTLAYFSRKR